MLAVLRASAVMPPRAGCCSVLRSTLRVAQLARGGLPRAHCRQVQSQPTTPAPDGTGSRQGAHNTPTFADPSRAPLPADTSVFVGTAFPRALAFDNSAAQLLATEMVGDLTDFAEKLRRLQLMCWDAGGQPAYVECERLKNHSYRDDGGVRTKIERLGFGCSTDTQVTGCGPDAAYTMPILATRPTEAARSVQGTKYERFAVVLPAQIYPEQDSAMVEVLDKMASILTPQQLTFLKTPSGYLKFGRRFDKDGVLMRRPFEMRQDFDASENAIDVGHNCHRKAERELLQAAKWIATPAQAANGFAQPPHHFGRRDLTHAEERDLMAPSLEWALGGIEEVEQGRRRSSQRGNKRPSNALDVTTLSSHISLPILHDGIWQLPDRALSVPTLDPVNGPASRYFGGEKDRVDSNRIVERLLQRCLAVLAADCPATSRGIFQDEVQSYRDRSAIVWAQRIIRHDCSISKFKRWVTENGANRLSKFEGTHIFPTTPQVLKIIDKIKTRVSKQMGVHGVDGPTGEGGIWLPTSIISYLLQHEDLRACCEFPDIDNAILVVPPELRIEATLYAGTCLEHPDSLAARRNMQYEFMESVIAPQLGIAIRPDDLESRCVMLSDIYEDGSESRVGFVFYNYDVTHIATQANRLGWQVHNVQKMHVRVVMDAGSRVGRTAGKTGQTLELMQFMAMRYLENSLIPGCFPTIAYTGGDSLELYNVYSRLVREDMQHRVYNGVLHAGVFYDVVDDACADGAARRELDGRVTVQGKHKEVYCDCTKETISKPGPKLCKPRQFNDMYTWEGLHGGHLPGVAVSLGQKTLGILVHLRNDLGRYATKFWQAVVLQGVRPYFSRDGNAASAVAIAPYQQTYYAPTNHGNYVHSTAVRLAGVKKFLKTPMQHVNGAIKIRDKVTADLKLLQRRPTGNLTAIRTLLKNVDAKTATMEQKFDCKSVEGYCQGIIDSIDEATVDLHERKGGAPRYAQDWQNAWQRFSADETAAAFDAAVNELEGVPELLEGCKKLRAAAVQLKQDAADFRASHPHAPWSDELTEQMNKICRHVNALPSDYALYKVCGGGRLKDALHAVTNSMTGKHVFDKPMLPGILHLYCIRGFNSILCFVGTLAWGLNIGAAFIADLKDGAPAIYAHYYEQYDKLKFGLIKARGHDALTIMHDPERYFRSFPQPYRDALVMLVKMWTASWYIVSCPYLEETLYTEDGGRAQAAVDLREMAAAMKDLLHALFSGKCITPTLHFVVDDIPDLFAAGVALWWGNEQTIEAGQQLARLLLANLQKSQHKNVDMIRDWMVYMESQLLVKTAQERQAQAKVRLEKEWSGARKERVQGGVQWLQAYNELKARGKVDYFDEWGSMSAKAYRGPVSAIAEAELGLISLPKILAELSTLEIGKVVVTSDSADGQGALEGTDIDAFNTDAHTWLYGAVAGESEDNGWEFETPEGETAPEPTHLKFVGQLLVRPRNDPHPRLLNLTEPPYLDTSRNDNKYLFSPVTGRWIKNSKANRDRIQQSWGGIVLKVFEESIMQPIERQAVLGAQSVVVVGSQGGAVLAEHGIQENAVAEEEPHVQPNKKRCVEATVPLEATIEPIRGGVTLELKRNWQQIPGVIDWPGVKIENGAEAFTLGNASVLYASRLRRGKRAVTIATRLAYRRQGFAQKLFNYAITQLLDAGDCDTVVLDVNNPDTMNKLVDRLLATHPSLTCVTRRHKIRAGVWLLEKAPMNVVADVELNDASLEDLIDADSAAQMRAAAYTTHEDSVVDECTAALSQAVHEVRGERAHEEEDEEEEGEEEEEEAELPESFLDASTRTKLQEISVPFQTRLLTGELKESWAQEPGLGSNFLNTLPEDTEIFTLLDDQAAVFAKPIRDNTREVDIVVREEHRRKGYGQLIFNYAATELLKTCKSVELHVKNKAALKKLRAKLPHEIVCNTPENMDTWHLTARPATEVTAQLPAHNIVVAFEKEPPRPLLDTCNESPTEAWERLLQATTSIMGTPVRQVSRYRGRKAMELMLDGLSAVEPGATAQILEVAYEAKRTTAARDRCEQLLSAAVTVLKDRDKTNKKSIDLNLAKAALGVVKKAMCAPTSEEASVPALYLQIPGPQQQVKPLVAITDDTFVVSGRAQAMLASVVGSLTAQSIAMPDCSGWRIDVAALADIVANS